MNLDIQNFFITNPLFHLTPFIFLSPISSLLITFVFVFLYNCLLVYACLHKNDFQHTEFEEALLKIPWYTWDAKSRKLYLLLLMSAQRKYSISIIPPYCLNRSFILWVRNSLASICKLKPLIFVFPFSCTDICTQ